MAIQNIWGGRTDVQQDNLKLQKFSAMSQERIAFGQQATQRHVSDNMLKGMQFASYNISAAISRI